jgi:hypothetical protein
MATKWVVTTPSDRLELDESQQGQLTFTVTNPTTRIDRVAFDILPQEGADASWFTVDEPQRRVPAGGSVSYVMKAAIPQTAKPGTYSVQGRAYSADSAPEEDSVLSSRVAVEVKPKAGPAPKKKFPWWIVVVAALVVIVLVVVLVLVFTGGKKPAPAPSASAVATGPQVTMPDLANQSGQQATTNIEAFGLSVGTVRYVQDARPGRVVYQSPAAVHRGPVRPPERLRHRGAHHAAAGGPPVRHPGPAAEHAVRLPARRRADDQRLQLDGPGGGRLRQRRPAVRPAYVHGGLRCCRAGRRSSSSRCSRSS